MTAKTIRCTREYMYIMHRIMTFQILARYRNSYITLGILLRSSRVVCTSVVLENMHLVAKWRHCIISVISTRNVLTFIKEINFK